LHIIDAGLDNRPSKCRVKPLYNPIVPKWHPLLAYIYLEEKEDALL